MKVNVSQEDIDKGVRGSEDSCPLALATRRAFNTYNVGVYYNNSDEGDKEGGREAEVECRGGGGVWYVAPLCKKEECRVWVF